MADGVGRRALAQEVDALDLAVGRREELCARRRLENGRVVANSDDDAGAPAEPGV